VSMALDSSSPGNRKIRAVHVRNPRPAMATRVHLSIRLIFDSAASSDSAQVGHIFLFAGGWSIRMPQVQSPVRNPHH